MVKLLSIVACLFLWLTGQALAQASVQVCSPVGIGSRCATVNADGFLAVDLNLAGAGLTTTQASAAPTATVFSSILSASTTRKGCTIQNLSATTGYVYFGATGSATTSNTFQVPPNNIISCNNPNGGVLQDNVAATCASGTCAFIVASQ